MLTYGRQAWRLHGLLLLLGACGASDQRPLDSSGAEDAGPLGSRPGPDTSPLLASGAGATHWERSSAADANVISPDEPFIPRQPQLTAADAGRAHVAVVADAADSGIETVEPADYLGEVCPDTPPPPPGVMCRDSSHCWCVFEDNGGSCGAINRAHRECESDADCAGGICESFTPELACTEGQATRCAERCEVTGCATDQHCGVAGHCEPLSCEDGFVCAPDRVCDGARAQPDAHGCGLSSCDQDGFECRAGWACRASGPVRDGHGCVPVRCSEGYTCPLNHECAPDGQAVDAHGCMRRACREDLDCDCGACVLPCAAATACDGTCQDRSFVCARGPVP